MGNLAQGWMYALLVASGASQWQACLTAVHRHLGVYMRGRRCEAQHEVRFDWSAYTRRVRATPGAPNLAYVCAPEVCSSEMVGRYVAPLFLLADFDPKEARLWPRLGTEVVVEDVPAVTIITTTSPFRGMSDGVAMISTSLRSLRRQPGLERRYPVVCG